jgi:hypothetical protein
VNTEKVYELTRGQLQELKGLIKALPELEGVLARHADDDPEARRLHRIFFAAPGRKTSEKIFLAAGDSAGDGSMKLDPAGHLFAAIPEASHCLACRVVLLAAGDPTIGHEDQFASTERHVAAQKLCLDYPGLSYLAAVERAKVEMAKP